VGRLQTVTVDPDNTNSFWLINEFARAANNWADNITNLLVTPVPEPGSLALVGLAAAGGWVWRRARFKGRARPQANGHET